MPIEVEVSLAFGLVLPHAHVNLLFDLGRKMYPTPLQMMREVAVGMAYLHRKGILHGDLKVSGSFLG